MNTDVDEGSEVGDVCNDTGEFHSYDEVGESMDILVEFEDFNLSTWIAPRLLKLGEDVAEGTSPNPSEGRGRQACGYFAEVLGRFKAPLSSRVRIGTPPLSGRSGGALALDIIAEIVSENQHGTQYRPHGLPAWGCHHIKGHQEDEGYRRGAEVR